MRAKMVSPLLIFPAFGHGGFAFSILIFFAAPVASAEAMLLLSGAPESNQRAPRGG
jgi:hypothetical protein